MDRLTVAIIAGCLPVLLAEDASLAAGLLGDDDDTWLSRRGDCSLLSSDLLGRPVSSWMEIPLEGALLGLFLRCIVVK